MPKHTVWRYNPKLCGLGTRRTWRRRPTHARRPPSDQVDPYPPTLTPGAARRESDAIAVAAEEADVAALFHPLRLQGTPRPRAVFMRVRRYALRAAPQQLNVHQRWLQSTVM